MKKRILFLLLTVLCSACGFKTDNSPGNNQVENNLVYATVCEINAKGTDLQNKVVRVRAMIVGYHEIAIYDDQCPESENYIQLKISREERDYLTEVMVKSTPSPTDIKGEIFLSGVFEVRAGSLFTYPGRVDKPLNNTELGFGKLIVNAIQVKSIDRFVPLTVKRAQ